MNRRKKEKIKRKKKGIEWKERNKGKEDFDEQSE